MALLQQYQSLYYPRQGPASTMVPPAVAGSTPPVQPKAAQPAPPPAPAASPPAVSQPTPPTPTPTVPWKALVPAIRDLLTPKSLDKAPLQTAQSLISHLASTAWNDIDLTTRKEILTRIRDGAGKEFYRAWAKSEIGLSIVRDWLRTTVQKDGWEETLMPLLFVSRAKFSKCYPKT